MNAAGLERVRAIVFDVFGTLVDWRSGVARDVAPFLTRHAPGIIGAHRLAAYEFADSWRRRYAKRAGPAWDAILGAEVTRAYKPMPEAYLRTVEVLAMRPAEVCLVAAHNSDLAAARSCGLRTAFGFD